MSHSLLAGGANVNRPYNYQTSGIVSRSNVWFYWDINNRSSSWGSVYYLYQFITNNNGIGPKAEEQKVFKFNCGKPDFIAEVGDIVQIDYEKDGTFDHSIVITDIKYKDGIYVPYIAGRSGKNSGLSKWFDTYISFSTVVKFRNGNSRLLHLTALA